MYARFLLEEILPEVAKSYQLTSDPEGRAICGNSSGGICAFTVAWERPDAFRKVVSHIGSFTNIRGGWEYPGLVRKSKPKPKPIKVYLQDGKDDLNNLHGNWPLANQDLAMALQFAGYKYKLEMTDGGHSGKFGGELLPEALKWLWNEKAESTKLPHEETKPEWKPHPDAVAQDGVPKGKVVQMPVFESKIFPNTIRDWSIYVPAQYKADKPSALMVFQDGEGMKGEKGRWRVPIVFDNLIAKGDMPPTIAVFVNPGHDKDKPRKDGKHSNRGFEYDSLGDRYVRFIIEEIIPEVKKTYAISDDPEMHAIGGSSSGAICAFTAAWERTDYFRKVYSSVGSFTNLRGGNVYPSLVRKTEPKPIRVYMADTSGDVDNAFGSWNMQDFYNKMNGLFIGISGLSWFVGIFSLIAGVIGIGNIMLVSIKERTKEIGIRRSIGATPANITGQIVQEALTLILIAGYFGLLVGVGVLACLWRETDAEGAWVAGART